MRRASWFGQLYIQVVIGEMNEARAVVNLIGNGVGTIAIARSDHALGLETVRQVIREQRGDAPPRITAEAHTAEAAEAH